MTDASVAQMVNVFGREIKKPIMLTVNNMHAPEHYGNLVAYLRLTNIIPPSTAPGGSAEPLKGS